MNKSASVKISWRLKAGLIVVVIISVLKFGFTPLYEWRNMNIQKIKMLQRVVAKKTSLIGREKEVNNLFLKAKNSYKKVAGFYAHGFSDAQSLQLSLQKEVEALASICGVVIRSTDWLNPSEGKIVQAPISVKCESSPQKLIQFIAAIERGKIFRTLDKLIIRSYPKDSIIKATLDISAYGIINSGSEEL